MLGSLFIRDDDSTIFDLHAADTETHIIKPFTEKLGPLKTQEAYAFGIFSTDEVQIYIDYDWTWNFDSSITLEIGMCLYEGDDVVNELIFDDLDGTNSKIVKIPKDAVDFEVKLNVFNEDENEPTFGSLKLFIFNEMAFQKTINSIMSKITP